MKKTEKLGPSSVDAIHKSEGTFFDRKVEQDTEGLKEEKLLIDPAAHQAILRLAGLDGDLTGKKALECGCGTGFISVLLAMIGAEVWCFDLSPKSIEMALKRASVNEVSDRVSAKVAAFENLDYEDESFDIIMGTYILHHISDKRLAGAQIRRMLKKGGRAIFFEVNANNPILMFFRSHVVGKSRFIPKVGTMEEHPLTTDDVEVLSSIFDNRCIVSYPRFSFFGKLDHQILKQRFKPISFLLEGMDRMIYTFFPPARKYSYLIMLEFTK